MSTSRRTTRRTRRSRGSTSAARPAFSGTTQVRSPAAAPSALTCCVSTARARPIKGRFSKGSVVATHARTRRTSAKRRARVRGASTNHTLSCVLVRQTDQGWKANRFSVRLCSCPCPTVICSLESLPDTSNFEFVVQNETCEEGTRPNPGSRHDTDLKHIRQSLQ